MFKPIQGIMVIKLLHKFQIDLKRNEIARVPTLNCFGRTEYETPIPAFAVGNSGKK